MELGAIGRGELCALGAALCWATSLLLFKKSEAITPQGLNLFKNSLALLLFGASMLVTGDRFPTDRSSWDWAMLAISGILGIALADTLTFMALRKLGPALLAVVDCAYAPTIVLLSVLMLGETLTAEFVVGGALVVAGVLVATLEKRGLTEGAPDTGRRDRRIGALLGIAGILTMGVGVIAIKPILKESSLLEVTTVRLAAGLAAQWLWLAAVPSHREALAVFKNGRVMRTLVPASLLGSYLAMLLWLAGFKWTSASTAAVLNQVSTVFTVILARVFLGEAVTVRRGLGVALAMGGAMTVLLGSKG